MHANIFVQNDIAGFTNDDVFENGDFQDVMDSNPRLHIYIY